MGRELQKKKNRSSLPKVKHKRKNQNSKKLQVKGNALVAANWNRKETLSQNYRRLGLVSKLNSRAGGVEVKTSSLSSSFDANKTAGEDDGLVIRNVDPTTLVPGTVRIERDPDTGAIVRVIGNGDAAKDGVRRWGGRELVDLLGDEDVVDEGVGQHDLPASQAISSSSSAEGGIVPELLRQAEGDWVRKRPRKQSRREEEWVEALVGRYGDDVRGMARDRKLNPMQQSEGDIGRRVKAWKKGRRKVAGDKGEEMEV
ncbi:MAG: hypothetical protein Q9212_004402 [Teloschistes hypoglaucus]